MLLNHLQQHPHVAIVVIVEALTFSSNVDIQYESVDVHRLKLDRLLGQFMSATEFGEVFGLITGKHCIAYHLVGGRA
jgi:uncharacterized protein YegL